MIGAMRRGSISAHVQSLLSLSTSHQRPWPSTSSKTSSKSLLCLRPIASSLYSSRWTSSLRYRAIRLHHSPTRLTRPRLMNAFKNIVLMSISALATSITSIRPWHYYFRPSWHKETSSTTRMRRCRRFWLGWLRASTTQPKATWQVESCPTRRSNSTRVDWRTSASWHSSSESSTWNKSYQWSKLRAYSSWRTLGYTSSPTITSMTSPCSTTRLTTSQNSSSADSSSLKSVYSLN